MLNFKSKSYVSILFLISIFFLTSCVTENGKHIIKTLKTSANTSEKKEALDEIENYFINAKFHHLRLLELAKMVHDTEFNVKLITQTAQYVSTIGNNTQLFFDIAKVAANTNHECEELSEILELAAISNSEAVTIVGLAERAAQATSDDDKLTIKMEIEKLKSTVLNRTSIDTLRNSTMLLIY